MSDTTPLDDMNDENIHLDVDPDMMRRVSDSIKTPAVETPVQPVQPSPVHATLPPKHISKSSQMESLMQDTEASPTYVPLPQMSAHAAVPVMAGDSAANIVMRSKKKSARWLSFDNLIEDAKYPLLLSLLYFVFQMPQARALMRRVFSFGYNEDCTANTIGYVMQSLLFALCAFMLATVQEEVLKQLE